MTIKHDVIFIGKLRHVKLGFFVFDGTDHAHTVCGQSCLPPVAKVSWDDAQSTGPSLEPAAAANKYQAKNI